MADGTRLKTMVADIKKLFELIGNNSTEIARMAKSGKSQMDAIQQSIGHILRKLDKPQQPRKLNFDLPHFDGTDALGWIFSADQYFDYYHIDEVERINIVAMHMTSNAIPWFQLTQRNFPFRSWHELKRAIEIEFGPSLFESPRESLFKLIQQGSVLDYYAEFITLANRAQLEPPEALWDCFISGLKPNFCREVKAQCPLA